LAVDNLSPTEPLAWTW